MKKRGICALCKDEKKFIRAHIISKAIFKSIFQDHNKVHYVNVSDLKKSNKVQDAFFDNALFCVDCDNSFSPFEQYFSDLISGKAIKLGLTANSKSSFTSDFSVDVFEGVDVRKLRMFFLILLWRSSISKQHAFRDIKLDNEMENWLELQIKTGILDNFERLPVILFSLKDVDDIRKESVIMPIKGIVEQKPLIIFAINGWVIFYGLENSEIPYFEYRLQKDNLLKIVRLGDEEGVILLDRLTHMNGPFRKTLIDELKSNKKYRI